MAQTDYVGYEHAAAISLNYALDSVETEILSMLEAGLPITPDSLRYILTVIKRQRARPAGVRYIMQ